MKRFRNLENAKWCIGDGILIKNKLLIRIFSFVGNLKPVFINFRIKKEDNLT